VLRGVGFDVARGSIFALLGSIRSAADQRRRFASTINACSLPGGV